MGYVIAAIVVLLIFIGGFKLWEAGEKADLQSCKDKYGSSYTLGHSSANSSIKWCVSPEGVMKDL